MTAKGKQTKQALVEGDITTTPVGRRSAFTMLGAGAIGLALGACHHGIRGCTDSDPMDRAGYGRRCGGGGYGGCSDRDPYDPVGRGRRC
jgi:hypothetical protein